MGYVFLVAGAILAATFEPRWIGVAVVALGAVVIIFSTWGKGRK